MFSNYKNFDKLTFMKKKCLSIIFLFIFGFLPAQSVKLTRITGQNFTTGGNYYDGEYISYASIPEETRYIKGFYISELITQELYEKVMGKNPSSIKNPNAPVTNVSIIDAMNFCMKLSKLDEYEIAYETDNYVWYNFQYLLHNIHGYRLPTEEEWEFCAKTGVINTSKNQLSEWVHNTWTTSTMKNKFYNDYGKITDKIPFDKRVNVTVRGQGSNEKRYSLNPETSQENLGFRVVISDMTEFGFPEQPEIPADEKPDTTIAELDSYLTNIENTKMPDEDGYIHATIKLAEIFPEKNDYKVLDNFELILNRHPKLRLILDLKNCRWQVSYKKYIRNYCEIDLFRIESIEGIILPETTKKIEFTECVNLKWVQLPQDFQPVNNYYGTYSENSFLKYIFVPGDNVQVPEEYNFESIVDTIFVNDTAEHYKSIDTKFEESPAIPENVQGCTSSFSKDAMYYGDMFDCEITIPESQKKKQQCTVYFASKYNRKFIFFEKKYKLNDNSDTIKLTKISTRDFDEGQILETYNTNNEKMTIQIQVKFEDCTVIYYFDSELLVLF